MQDNNNDFNYGINKKGLKIDNGSLSKVMRIVTVLTLTMILTLATIYVTFLGPYHTALAATSSDQTSTSTLVNGNLNSNDNNLSDLAQNITSKANNIVTSIIGNSGSLGGFSVNAKQNQFGAVNNITTAIIGNTVVVMPKTALSGKIASAQFNFQTGNIEATLFGNWSLHMGPSNDTNLAADFVMRNISNTNINNLANSSTTGQAQEFTINGLKINSFQQTSGNNNTVLALRGITNLTAMASSQNPQTRSIGGIPISITIIQNKIVIFSFDSNEQKSIENSAANAALLHTFENLPIIGRVTMMTG